MRAKLLLLSLVLTLLFMGSVIAQGTTVSGVVLSAEDGSPLPGANVIVKNTQKGASTDLDGIYLLEDVSPQDTLVFMYVGYSNVEVTVGDRKEINVRLIPEAFSADAIVVIGYGTQQRKDITNAIGSLSPQDFNRGAITDPMQLAQSRMAGVKIVTGNGDLGFAPMIRIRGGTSVSASNEPMYVIDGVPVENVSATPTFDPQGNSGGTGEDNPAGGLRDNPLSNLDPNDIESIDILKDASSAATYGARGGNGVILITTKSGTPGGSALNYRGFTSMSSQYGEYDLLNAQEYRDYAAQVGATPEMGTANTDWQDAIARTAYTHSHSLSFSSGNESTSYLVSLNYLDEQGIILNSDRQRVSGRFNIKHQMYDNKLRLGMILNPSYITRNNTPYRQIGGFRGGLFTNVLKHNPTLPVKNSDGSFYSYASPDIRNPVAMVELIEDQSEIMQIFANFNVEYDFIPELTGRINLGFDRSDANRAIYQPNSIPYAATFGGRADIEDSDRRNTLFEATANYQPDIGANHDLEVLAGYTYQDFENSTFGTTAQGFVTDAWSYNNIGGGEDFTVRPFSFRADNRIISFLGRAIYSLDDKYLFNAALRYEGSSKFGEGNKWGTFPSIGVGWRLSAEPFLKDSKSLNDLKIRLSYGVTGNEDIGNYNSLVILGPGANAVIGDQVVTGVSATQLANPDLRWEETSQINLGLDFSFLNNRVSGSIDVYTKKTKDLLINFEVPQPSVVTTVLANAGEVENKGLEISLNTINYSSTDLFWRSTLNFATNSNKVLNLGDREFITTGRVSGAGLSGVRAQIILPGHPLGTFFGPRFEGYDAEGNEIITTTGGPLNDGRYVLGDARPDFTWGFSNIMVWKGFDFLLFIQGAQGFELLNNTRLEYQRPSNVFNSINLFRGALDDVANGMDPSNSPVYTDRFIEDASYIRLQNITLGYTFETDFFRKLRVYLAVDNLFVITDYQGLDPEVNTFAIEGGQVATLGVDYTNYPRARTFSIGLNVGFK